MSLFESELTTLAFCWRLDRADGVTIGLTSHDRDVWFRDLLHRAAPGMVPSAIETSRSMESASVDLDGMITSDLVTEADLSAGLWNGARLGLHAVDWRSPDASPVFLVRGRLGKVNTDGHRFSVELTGALAMLDRPVSETTTPHCRAALGDVRCRIDLRGRRVLARCHVARDQTLEVNTPFEDGRFTLGRVRWLTGPWAGRSVVVLSQTGALLEVADPVPTAVVGHGVEITEGCDRTMATCSARFGNAINFQGEPHLPGNDLLSRYGG